MQSSNRKLNTNNTKGNQNINNDKDNKHLSLNINNINNHSHHEGAKSLKSGARSVRSNQSNRIIRRTPEQQQIEAEKYENEIKMNLMPRRVKDLNEYSPISKDKYELQKKHLKQIDCLLCGFSFIVIIFAIVDSEYISNNFNMMQRRFILENVNQVCRVGILICNAFSTVLIYLRYSALLMIHKLKLGEVAEKDGFLDTGMFWSLILELAINLVFLPPRVEKVYRIKGSIYVHYNYENLFNFDYINSKQGGVNIQNPDKTLVILYYGLSNVMTVFILIRSYHFIRIIHTFSYWATPRAQNVCKLMNTDASISFGIKAYLKQRPFISLACGMVFVISLFGLGMKIFEFYNLQMMELIDSSDGAINGNFASVMKKFKNILNSFWLIIVTMTTIGYGDIFPTTYFGRILSVIACIMGTFVISLLVVFFNSKLAFDEVESHIYNSVIISNSDDKELEQRGGRLLFMVFQYNYLKSQRKAQSRKYRLYIRTELNYKAMEFKIFRMENKKSKFDINDILGKIKFNYENCIVPLKKTMETYNKERVVSDHSHNYLKDSVSLCSDLLKESTQLVNLLKVLNTGSCLDNLGSVSEVYSNHATITEEIVQYHKFKNIEKMELETEGSMTENTVYSIENTVATDI